MDAAAGPISLAQQRLADMLSQCAAFQTLVSAADAAAALTHIYHEALPEAADGLALTPAELQSYRPYAIVCTAPEQGWTARKNSMGTSTDFLDSGRLVLLLERSVPAEAAQVDVADRAWKNTIGLIAADMLALAGTAGYIDIDELTVAQGSVRAHPDEVESEGDWQGVEIHITWGTYR